jgi:hypothetical protein
MAILLRTSGGFHADLAGLSLGDLGQREGQDAVLERRNDFVGVDAGGELVALGEVDRAALAAVRRIAFGHCHVALATQGDRFAGDADLNVAFGQPGDIGGQHEVAAVVFERGSGAAGLSLPLDLPEQPLELAAKLLRAAGVAEIREAKAGPVIEITETRENGVLLAKRLDAQT